MIRPLELNKATLIDRIMLFDFITVRRDPDFYMTEDNKRIYMTSLKVFEKFLKSTTQRFVYENEDEDATGIVLIWKSVVDNLTRHYVKLIAENSHVAQALLTVVNWNCPQILYTKIHKTSPFLSAFRSKGFHFEGDRGKQILLKRSEFRSRPRIKLDKADGDDSLRN